VRPVISFLLLHAPPNRNAAADRFKGEPLSMLMLWPRYSRSRRSSANRRPSHFAVATPRYSTIIQILDAAELGS
jgi:hypothetical protein